MKRVLLILSLFLLGFVFLSSPSSISAQGFVTCSYFGDSCLTGNNFCAWLHEAPSDWAGQCSINNGLGGGCLGMQIPCVPVPCGDEGDICCEGGGTGGLWCNPPNIPNNPNSPDPSFCHCMGPADACGDLYEPCCGLLAPHYCHDPLLPSNEWDSFSCTCENPPAPPPPPGGGVADGACKTPGSSEYNGVMTAIGCIGVIDLSDLMVSLSTIMFSVAGGIAFLMMVFGAIQVLTSAGDPKKLQGGRQLITSALLGLLFIVFAVFIFRTITRDILHLPGFS
ncbi:hypothetical protein ACFL0Y_01125 [Patescibacteria group bacterium]